MFIVPPRHAPWEIGRIVITEERVLHQESVNVMITSISGLLSAVCIVMQAENLHLVNFVSLEHLIIIVVGWDLVIR